MQRQCAITRRADGGEGSWYLQHGDGHIALVSNRPIMCSDDWLTLCKVAVAGLGIAAVPAHECRAQLQAGALERVRPDWRAKQALLSVLTPARRATLPATRAPADFLLCEPPPAMS